MKKFCVLLLFFYLIAGKVSAKTAIHVDESLVLGSANAPINMTVFLGYREPFVRRFWDDTYPTLKENYIDKGIVRVSLRPFVLFENNEKLAMLIVECTRNQSENSAQALVETYFASDFGITEHKEVENKMYEILSRDSGVNTEKIIQCVNEEVFSYRLIQNKKLFTENSDSGGQPTFLIEGFGKIKIISGAQPLKTFEETLNGLISRHNSLNFKDVPPDNPHYDAILYAKEKGIVKGYQDGTFRPDSEINRAEFIKIITSSSHVTSLQVSIEGKRVSGCSAPLFSDVSQSDWYSDYICIAKKYGIIEGYLDGTFRPGESIIFVDAAKIIVKGYNLPLPKEAYINWYYKYLESLDRVFGIPLEIEALDQRLTRGQMAEIIYRINSGIQKPAREPIDLK